MKSKTTEINIEQIVRKVIERLRLTDVQILPLLVAHCSNENDIENVIADLYQSQKNINLGYDFNKLDSDGKFLFIQGAITAHFQSLDGHIPYWGEIINYELIDKKDSSVFFELDGKLKEL
jgi:hypothetical protein